MSIQLINQMVNTSVSKRQPTCQFNTSINTTMHQLTSTNASIQHINQHINTSVSKRQPTCRFDISINTAMHKLTSTSASIQHVNQYVNASVNFNQHVDSTLQLIRQYNSRRQPTCGFNTSTDSLLGQFTLQVDSTEQTC